MTIEVALPYHEPDVVIILIFASFLLLLNVINYVLDRIAYIGLLGQIFVGIAWGTPAGKWLAADVEPVFVNIGYLGLLLLVFEGGLTTSFTSLKANLWLSSFVAITGVSLPIGLSYILVVLADASPLQAFAAGAALCSTSLGTTFTVLRTSGLHVTRLGVVLTSAAMMDDVVGLIMVQVISNLGQNSTSFNAATVVRPVFVSLAFGTVVPLGCRFIILPLTTWVNRQRAQRPKLKIWRVLILQETVFIVHTSLLVGMVTAATYAGTSNLLAAYLVGAAVSWWDSDVPRDIGFQLESHQLGTFVQNNRSPLVHDTPIDNQNKQFTSTLSMNTNREHNSELTNQEKAISLPTTPSKERNIHEGNALSGHAIFEKYYSEPLKRILQPFFFASIGFSVPITRMFSGSIVWRGAIYALLMFLGKFACGLWLVRMTWPQWLRRIFSTTSRATDGHISPSPSLKTKMEQTPGSEVIPTSAPASATQPPDLPAGVDIHNNDRNTSHQTEHPAKPVSLYPATIVGCAMVARGEIGFLISSLAEANGVFGDEPNTPLFLIVTWAIMLCTLVGPICVGLVVKRLRSLARGTEEGQCTRKRDVLGVWGID